MLHDKKLLPLAPAAATAATIRAQKTWAQIPGSPILVAIQHFVPDNHYLKPRFSTAKTTRKSIPAPPIVFPKQV